MNFTIPDTHGSKKMKSIGIHANWDRKIQRKQERWRPRDRRNEKEVKSTHFEIIQRNIEIDRETETEINWKRKPTMERDRDGKR